MWNSPSYVVPVVGKGSAFTSLNAFDNALLDAGIANYNHIKLSSILAPHITLIPLEEAELPPEGALLPGVISECRGKKGEFLISSLAFAFNKDEDLPGMIFELNCKDVPLESAEKTVELMVLEGMKNRNWKVSSLSVYSSSLLVEAPFGCTVALAVMLP